jgi:hypothetical protein
MADSNSEDEVAPRAGRRQRQVRIEAPAEDERESMRQPTTAP